MKKKIILCSILFLSFVSFMFSENRSEKAIQIFKNGSIKEYPELIIKEAITNNIIEPEIITSESLNGVIVTLKGYLNGKNIYSNVLKYLINSLGLSSDTDIEYFTDSLDSMKYDEFNECLMEYVFLVNLEKEKVELSYIIVNDQIINTNTTNYEAIKSILLSILFGDEKEIVNYFEPSFDPLSLVNGTYNKVFTPSIPNSAEYSSAREILDWYTDLGTIQITTADNPPATVRVDVALGYKKDDESTATEIKSRIVEIKSYLRRFFNSKTAEELSASNEDALENEIKNDINDKILSSSRIRDVVFLEKNVTQLN